MKIYREVDLISVITMVKRKLSTSNQAQEEEEDRSFFTFPTRHSGPNYQRPMPSTRDPAPEDAALLTFHG